MLLRKDGVGSLWVPKGFPALIYLEVGVRVGLSYSLRGWRLGVDWQQRLLGLRYSFPIPRSSAHPQTSPEASCAGGKPLTLQTKLAS